ncbi:MULTISPECIES: sigma-54 dependent transcriptional regulator [unclassified Moritella]|uniref:sigma-54-dependent transcriptional regulator n=1 Tax=unclassified Moritella TaxID=2637987 RepID=UPI001BAB7138|nr:MULTISPECIES: sigma-54 dependent transcriptional regulator [unclassified Moritella]QUM83964.1 sigma-54-dependent Fis family transcriptional regulator [Moritella sp. 28]QUM88271.1 sigma-54-dependent Fis family transcriptional regulator [Moritella sp. 36]
MSHSQILVVEDDLGLREALVDTLLMAGYECDEVDSGESALIALGKKTYDMVVSDIQMGGMTGLTLLHNIKQKHPDLPVLLMTAYAKVDDAVTAMRNGAVDYIGKPFSPEVLINQVGRYVPPQKIAKRTPCYGDEKTEQLLSLARKVAKSDATVMVTGPSGTGKEVLSRYIHDNSLRYDGPFVAINCAAIPDNMLEATLFGYEKGAFTGAIQACPGKFEQAQNGTILLDEISEMDLSLQVKLLRVLQEREVERLGSRKTIKLNIRVIATSNRNMKQAVSNGDFREDLYYRLNVFPLAWLPLTERKGDILPIAEHLLKLHCKQNNIPTLELLNCAKAKLQIYHWPGNVRELDNVIQRAMILAVDGKIKDADLILEDFTAADFQVIAPIAQVPQLHIKSEIPVRSINQPNEPLGNELRQQEYQIILETLIGCNGVRKNVSEKLGISPRTLRYKLAKMREQGIEIPA